MLNTKKIFKNIHHIAIICSDYPKSKHFYSEILGFSIVHEVYRKARDSYKLDLQVSENTQIELFSFPQSPIRPSYPEACGLRHLAFAVDDIEKAVKYLETMGISCENIRIDEFTGKRYTFFEDPDQLPLEIYEII